MKNEADTINSLEADGIILIEWFGNNLLKMNTNKSDIIITSDEGNTPIHIGNYIVISSSKETLLGIVIDYELTFNLHVEKVCKKLHKSDIH